MSFGEVDGVEPGTLFQYKQDLANAGVHHQVFGGMAGGEYGTESIVLNEGYVDDKDLGATILYTGHGGQDDQGRQVSDQQWVRANAGMRVNQAQQLPVRVTRGYKLRSGYAPTSGYRYDGLYRVEDCWQEPSIHGPLVCRFKLIELTEPGVQARPTTRNPIKWDANEPREPLPELSDEQRERIRLRREQRRLDR